METELGSGLHLSDSIAHSVSPLPLRKKDTPNIISMGIAKL
jgi:hypothetical protein